MDKQNHKRIIVLLGISGAGKGTQSQFLEDHRGYQRIVAGDVVREISKEDSDLGHLVKKTMESGAFLDDSIITKIIHRKLELMDVSDDIIFDGYPRSVVQKHDLDKMAKEFDYKHIIALWIDIPRETAADRLQKRSLCGECGKIFTSSDIKQCDKCGSTNIIIRKDDINIDAINKRLDSFYEQVMPAIKLYESEGRLVHIDGTMTISDVNHAVVDKLDVLSAYEI